MKGRLRIYLAAPLLGSPEGPRLAGRLAEALAAAGAEIVNPWVLRGPEAAEPRRIYARDTSLIRGADGLVAEVSLPSLGVGYEVAYALCHGKPVAALAREGARVSAMIRGVDSPLFTMLWYSDPQGAAKLAVKFIASRRGYAERSA